MSRLMLAFLGPPIVTCDGRALRVDTRKAVALLAYLATTAARHRRDALAALLWPESDQAGARAALRRTLSALNRGLADDWLVVDRETVGLRRDDECWVDVERFHRRLAACRTHGHPATAVCPACLPLLADAAELYRDDFLVGFTLRDSPAFDDWQARQAEGLRHDLAGALRRLVEGHGQQGAFETAIAYARRGLALDPLHEPTQRQLMRVYAWAGQPAAALRQYRECVRILDQELGVPPVAETTDLYHAIKAQRLPPPAAPAGGPDPRPTPATRAGARGPARPGPPLVGRAAEWARLCDAYAASRDGGQIVILEGEAGIGKSRLAEDFLATVRAEGAATLAMRGFAGEAPLAYGPFIEGLRAAVQDDRAGRLAEVPARWLAEAARLAPELTDRRPGLPVAPPLDSPGAQSRFFEGVSQVLLAACDGARPGVLAVDDLHWADDASLDLLTYLVRRLRGRAVCILVSWRGDQPAAEPRLRRFLAESRRAGTVTLLPLARLGRAAVLELVRAVAPALPPAVGERVYREAEGLPFFVTEYLSAIAQGGPAAAAGATEGAWPLPHGARDLLRGRLAAVAETGRQVLQAAAVIGRSFDFDTLREASGRGEEEVVAALEALVADGLVREVRGGTADRPLAYDFAHEQLRALVYDETGLARRRLLHRRIAAALAGRARGGRDAGALAGRIAGHYRLAGQATEAATWFALAGERARGLYANAEALAHFQAALALGHPAAAALHEAIGDLHTLAGAYGAAIAGYETAAALGAPAALATLEHKLGGVHLRRGAWELAESHFQAALAALEDTGQAGDRARLHADWGLAAHRRGHTERATARARESLALAEAAGDTRALAQAHNLLGMFAAGRGDRAAARGWLEQSLTLADALGEAGARVAARNNLALVCAADGDGERALALTAAALDLCAAQGDRHREAALHNNLADLLHAAGRAEEAMPHLKAAVAIYAEIGVEAGAVQPHIWALAEW
ncbi:MAG TPA: AAA family ATPase [Thermomicrobiales bacterium]|nr:AAA family ATPase [Thermomicrobiales bacterium]